MSWVFVLAYVLMAFGISLGVICWTGMRDAGGRIFFLCFFLIVSLAGLLLYHTSVIEERDCLHLGGEVVNTECKIVQELDIQ